MKDLKNFKHFNPMALREKYSVKNLNKKNNYSSFWLDDGWDTTSSIFDDEVEVNKKPKVDLVALAGYRRAVSNFVSIVTGDSSIKVNFTSRDDSYTDGKTVTIGSKLDDKLFDSSVGLALHEGSHIKLSDFDFLKNLEMNIPKEYYNRAEVKGFSKGEILTHLKNLLNYVEDRRIDHFIFTTSPGYKGYYHSMYDKYFHSKVVDKALKSTEYTSKDWDSYIFRIINLTNKNTNLDALPGLREIRKLIFGTVKSMESTGAAFGIALQIYDTILNNIPDGTEKVDNETGEVTYEKGDGSDSSDDSDKLTDEEFNDLLNSTENDETSGVTGNTKSVELTPHQKIQLDKAITKQKDFVNGDVKKTGKLTKSNSRELKTIEASGMTYEEVGKGIGWNKKGVKCLVVKKLTKELIESSGHYEAGLNILSPYKYSKYYYDHNSDKQTGFVEEGIRLGTILGRKLQVRGESRETKWTRLDSGKIDKRLISELGFGNERVFNTSFIESYSDAFLHISIDASGSMGGDKWDKTMTSVVAICKATSMIQNVDVVVSIRSTHNTGGHGRNSGDKPLILIAYDSRVDKFSKVKNLFAHIKVSGTTPEGLCYEAIMNEIVPTTEDRDSYFLNFSDGMPMFSNKDIEYYHNDAINHTKKMINTIKEKGIKVLSYYIGSENDWDHESTIKDFKRMYGKDSEFVDVTSVLSITKTMNKKFLEKS
jgi:hypothetical protein